MIYILEFHRPLGNRNNPRGQAHFYVGYCEEGRLEDRIEEHRQGRGAAITAACNRLGIAYDVVAVLPNGNRDEERRIKRMKNTPKLVEKLRKKKNIQSNPWMLQTSV